MNLKKITPLIGEVVKTAIISHRFGDAALHAKGFVSCDPCYLSEVWNGPSGIMAAMRKAYPWDGYDYPLHNQFWTPFEWNGATCYYRNCSDGQGFFGHCVDSGCVAVIPLSACPPRVQQLLS
jgi:hypothetical protein